MLCFTNKRFTLYTMEKLYIDYSMGRGKKASLLFLGSIHILIGTIALIGAIVQHLNIFVIIGIAIYTCLGIGMLSSIFNRLHHYIDVDEKQFVFKSRFNRSATHCPWDDITCVILSPNGIKLLTHHRMIHIDAGVLSFRDLRRIKNKIEQIAQKKNIPCVRIKQIRKKENSK